MVASLNLAIKTIALPRSVHLTTMSQTLSTILMALVLEFLHQIRVTALISVLVRQALSLVDRTGALSCRDSTALTVTNVCLDIVVLAAVAVLQTPH